MLATLVSVVNPWHPTLYQCDGWH